MIKAVFADLEYRREFVKLGGLVNLVELIHPLRPSDEADEELCLTQIEAIYHLEDFIMVLWMISHWPYCVGRRGGTP